MKNVVQDLTSGGIDWQREKWQSGLGSKFIHQGEKNAAKYMCLQLFTLSVSHKVFTKLISNPVTLGWIGIGVTLVGVGIAIEMYDKCRMLMEMKCNSNSLLRP